jgi:DNA polymerase-3 subunit epsilon
VPCEICLTPRASPGLSVATPTVSDMRTVERPAMVQGTFDDLGTPLSTVTFVVVDLETTGGSPAECGITEIGAVKVRGGEVIGEFQTLVNPGGPIPAFISVLTGITDSMVAAAPRIEAALPAFLEFAKGSVLVAHNAGFDISFLKAAARRTEHEWPGFRVLDTVHLARQLVRRDEVPNHRLASLARLFRATTTPDHRALHDARATVDVLHGLLERVGSLGVHSLEELLDYTARVSPARRRKRHLADELPDAPGVYLFKDGQGHVLYVGTSVSIRTRVRSYFTASEHRRRMGEMVRIAESVSPIVCATTLEAEVRELRLIAQHKPRYNRRSRNPEKAPAVRRACRRRRWRPVCRALLLALSRRGRDRRRPRGASTAPVPGAALPHQAQVRLRSRRVGALRRTLHRRPVRRRLRRCRRPGRRAARGWHP